VSRSDFEGEWVMVSQDTENLPPDVRVVVRFDGARSESWSLPQEVPEYAVANRKVRSQRIRGSETFTAEVVLSETPLPRPVQTYLGGYDPDVDILIPEDVRGPRRVKQARDGLREHLDQKWTLHTSRHGRIQDMVLVNTDLTFDDHKGVAAFRLSFTKWVSSDITSIKVQRAVRAKKGAAKNTANTAASEHDFETSPVDQPTATIEYNLINNTANLDAQDQINAINDATINRFGISGL